MVVKGAGTCWVGWLVFFEGSGDTRDLHSFPTRRGSDLGCLSSLPREEGGREGEEEEEEKRGEWR